jgi:hypothetical protein
VTLDGTVLNGTIVLDQPQMLPEGVRVAVTVIDNPGKNMPTLQGLLKLVGTLDDLPADFAAEHDHYIHGTPKREQKEN